MAASVLAMFVSACTIRCSKDKGKADLEERSEAALQSCVDGKRALGYIEEIAAFGPRHAGTPGAEKTRKYIEDKLKSFGLAPKRAEFTAFTPLSELGKVQMSNISVDIPGPGQKWVLIGGHFDGKLIKGVDFKGANDGGSSTALLLEMARCLKISNNACPVRIAFFDGEEAIVEWSDMDGLYGSKNMAAELKANGQTGQFAAAVIVDMIGDKRLKITRETRSTPWVFETLERAAVKLGHAEIFDGPRAAIDDDHMPLLRIGIPAAVLIDLEYGSGWNGNDYWHTDKDTVDKLSADSIEAVGQVVMASLFELASGGPPGR